MSERDDLARTPSTMSALRRWAYGRLFIGSLESLSRALRHVPHLRPERNGVEVFRDVPYVDDGRPEHRLDIYRPADAEGPLPAVLYVHGGGFRYFDKETHWAMAAAFARRGFVTFNVNYRRSDTHTYPAAVEDVFDACLWMQEHAESYGADLDRSVWAGESAGGNLVLGLAVAACWRRPEPWARRLWEAAPRPRVLLPACGYLEVSNPDRHARERPMPRWMADRIEQVSDVYLPDHRDPDPSHAFANPLTLLEGADPPERPFPATFAIVGDKDPVMGDTVRLGEALDALDVPNRIKIYPGGVHAFHALRFHRLAKEAWRDQFAFIDEHVRG
ncbi:MAG: alpha/beta hydrolase [Myxococcota bacterium]